jgi:WD40 repeat protein
MGVRDGLGSSAVSVREASSGREAARVSTPSGTAQALAFSPDGRSLAGACRDAVYVWDAATGRELAALRGHSDEVTEVAFTPDGRSLLSSSDDTTALVWDVGKVIRRPR